MKLAPWAAGVLAVMIPGLSPPTSAQEAGSPPYAQVNRPDTTPPAFHRTRGGVARALEIPPLWTTGLPDGHREIRIWVDRGLIIPHEMVRIVAGPDTVTGQWVAWWSEEPGDTAAWREGFRRDQEERAGPGRCRSAPVRETSWGRRVTVETLEGSRYRGHGYASPWEEHWPEARRAGKVLRYVIELMEAWSDGGP